MSVPDRVATIVGLYHQQIAPFIEQEGEPEDLDYSEAADAAHTIADECASLADEVMMNSQLPNDALQPLEDVAHYMHQVALAFESASGSLPQEEEMNPAYEGAVNGLDEVVETLDVDGVSAVVEE